MLRHQEHTQRLVPNQLQEIHARGLSPELKIRPYDENDHVGEFLAMFEQTIDLHHIEEQDWVCHIVSLISGRAKAYYNEVDTHAEYAVVKQAILDQLQVTPDASRVKLRRMSFQFGEDIEN